MVKHSKITKVFQLSLVIIFILVLLGLFVPQQFQNISFYLKNLLTTSVGWFYLLLVTGILIFCVFLIVSPIGQIRLGNPTSRPEHSTTSWIAMMFSAGMGIGLVFYGAAEPLSHFAISTPNAEIGSADALADAFRFTFFHWGFHAWAVYALVGLSLAYFGFRKREKYQLSVVFKPLFGKYADGPIATIIDTITIIATVIGVATTLGFGASQINGGLSYVFGIPNNSLVQVIIIIIATILFLISALSGLGKGVKILSNTNLILAIVLLAGVIVLGPTVKIFDTMTDSIGLYFQNFFRMSFRAAAFDETKRAWINQWTIFYWAWWISWSPFVGVFFEIGFRSFVNNGYTVLNAVANCLNFGNRILLFAFEVEKFCRKIKAHIFKAVCFCNFSLNLACTMSAVEIIKLIFVPHMSPSLFKDMVKSHFDDSFHMVIVKAVINLLSFTANTHQLVLP